MTWTPALTELRAAFEETFASPDTIGMVLDDAGIPRARINLQSSPAQAWHDVLTEAQHLNRVEALIAVARRQYPANARLKGACDQYLRSMVPAEHVVEFLKPSMIIGALNLGPVNPIFGATGCFYIAVRNGRVPLWPTLKMTDFSEIALNETPLVAHWRGYVFPHYLSVEEPQHFGLLGIGTLESQNPVLFVWTQGDTRIPVTRDLPIETQEPVEFVVTFYGKYTVVARRTGELNHEDEKILARRKYRVAPDTSRQAQFKYRRRPRMTSKVSRIRPCVEVVEWEAKRYPKSMDAGRRSLMNYGSKSYRLPSQLMFSPSGLGRQEAQLSQLVSRLLICRV